MRLSFYDARPAFYDARPDAGPAMLHRPLVQRACACGGTPGPTGECARCRRKRLEREGRVQRKAAHARCPGASDRRASDRRAAPPSVHATLERPGRALDPPVRHDMEARVGHDFSRVRVHTDAQAAASARDVNALAYTVGQDVVFAAGQYAPASPQGRWLLAHELAHTVQQRDASPPPSALQPLRMGTPGDRHEREADRAAGSATSPTGWQPALTPSLAVGSVQPYLARVDCSRLNYRQCRTGVHKCGYGLSGTCGWVGPTRGGCICVGQRRRQPSYQRVLEALLILGLSITLVATVIAALLDPEPATKLALAGLTVAQASALLVMLGYEDPDNAPPEA